MATREDIEMAVDSVGGYPRGADFASAVTVRRAQAQTTAER